MKKLLMFLICAALMPVAAQAEIFDEIEIGEIDGLSSKIESKKAAAAPAYKYNYKPVVFEITTEYKRNIYSDMGEDINGRHLKNNLNYKQGLFDETVDAKCYGTLINKDYILTHKNCFKLPDMDYTAPDAEGAMVNFVPLNMTFEKDGRELEFDMRNVKKSFIDEKSGAALINIKDMCFHKKGTTASNVCVQLWEYFFSSKKETFNIKNNYGTIILSNIAANDKVGDSFLKRVFFTPKENDVTVAQVKNGVLSLKGSAKKSLAGEPLFHRVDGGKNILVGIRTSNPDKDGVIKYTKSQNIALFSPDFTKLIKNNVKTGGVKLTKDLNAATSL